MSQKATYHNTKGHPSNDERRPFEISSKEDYILSMPDDLHITIKFVIKKTSWPYHSVSSV